MSHYAEETYTVYDERDRKARKTHVCQACRETIAAGTRYWSVFTLFDGYVERIKRCSRCQAIHRHIRQLAADADNGMWPDERLNCGERYEDEWGDMPVAAQELAFLLPGEQPGVLVGGSTCWRARV